MRGPHSESRVCERIEEPTTPVERLGEFLTVTACEGTVQPGFCFEKKGVLVYRSRGAVSLTQLAWYDRSGKILLVAPSVIREAISRRLSHLNVHYC